MHFSWNRGTPKSSILMGFSIINLPFFDTTIYGNPHVCRNMMIHKWMEWDILLSDKAARTMYLRFTILDYPKNPQKLWSMCLDNTWTYLKIFKGVFLFFGPSTSNSTRLSFLKARSTALATKSLWGIRPKVLYLPEALHEVAMRCWQCDIVSLFGDT